MTWPKIVILVWMSIGIIGSIANIGKPRKPITPKDAARLFAITGVFAALIVIA